LDGDLIDQFRREVASIPCVALRQRRVCVDKHCVYGHKKEILKTTVNKELSTPSNLPSEDNVQEPTVYGATSPHWEPSSPIWEPSSSPIEGPSSPTWDPSGHGDGLGAVSPVRRSYPSDETRRYGAISPMELPDKYDRYGPLVSHSVGSNGDAASRFYQLLKILRDLHMEGNDTPLRSVVGERLKWQGDHIFRLSGVTTFKGYVELAAKVGLIDLIPPSHGPGTERLSLREIRS